MFKLVLDKHLQHESAALVHPECIMTLTHTVMQKLPKDTTCSLFLPLDTQEPLKPEIILMPEVSPYYAERYFSSVYRFLPLAFANADFSLLQEPITEGPQALSPSVPGRVYHL